MSLNVRRRRTVHWITATFLLFSLFLFVDGGFGEETTKVELLLSKYSGALVTLEFVARVDSTGGGLAAMLGSSDPDFSSEAMCLIIDPKGIILCSNTQLDGYTRLMQRFLGPAGQGLELLVTPARIKVLTENNVEPYKGRLIARDTDLDLAWVEIVEQGERRFPFVDIKRGAEPKVGQKLFLLQRMEKHFDRALVAFEGEIGGATRQPRLLFFPTIQLETGFGLPAFTGTGEFLGMTVLQLPNNIDHSGNSGTLGIMRQTTQLRKLSMAVILPASEISKATDRALKNARQTSEE